MKINKNNDIASIYWEERFKIGISHHSRQNILISKDFIENMSEKLDKIIYNSLNLIEIGCGTGELSLFLSQKYPKLDILATDLSKNGIDFANSKYKSDKLSYMVFDCINGEINKKFDISICSNTLEHFVNPYEPIDRILEISDKLIILVPYNQPLTDGYSCEGGAGHVFHFTEESFSDYRIHECYTFSSKGWQYSSAGEIPLQLCIVISKK
jgi:SAM-dependent methyltransferase